MNRLKSDILKTMDVKLTPEVTSAHKNLNDLCEKFETSVDELCAVPPESLHTQDFYESECVPIAVECVDALSKFQSACSYEVTAYEAEIAAADDALRKQKCKLEADAAQRVETYEAEIAAADDALRKRKRELEENATQNILKVQSKVEEFSESAKGVPVDLSHVTDIDPKEFLEKNRESNNLTISYQEALKETVRAEKSSKSLLLMKAAVGGLFLIPIFLLSILLLFGLWLGTISINYVIGSICCLILAIIVRRFADRKAKNIINGALHLLCSTAEEECYLVGKEMQNEIMKIAAEYDKKVNQAHTKKERGDKSSAKFAVQGLSAHYKRVNYARSQRDQGDKQDVEWAANTIANYNKRVNYIHVNKEREDEQASELAMQALSAHHKRVNYARSRREQAIAYIKQEYHAFDTRLCQYMNKFQGVLDTWTTQNVNVASMLDENQVQNIGNNNEARICSSLTRVGTFTVWNISGKGYGISQEDIGKSPLDQSSGTPTDRDDIATVKSYLQTIANADTAILSIGRTPTDQNDIEAVVSYHQTIVNLDTTIQPTGHEKKGQDDLEVVKSYLQVISNIDEQKSDEAQKNINRLAKQGHLDAQYTLGNMYYSGQSVEQNDDEAVGWYKKAAEQGHADAQHRLDEIYNVGSGVERDVTKAVEWYRKAAEQGDADAQYALGEAYFLGRGVEKDVAEAVKWYRKANGQADTEG